MPGTQPKMIKSRTLGLAFEMPSSWFHCWIRARKLFYHWIHNDRRQDPGFHWVYKLVGKQNLTWKIYWIVESVSQGVGQKNRGAPLRCCCVRRPRYAKRLPEACVGHEPAWWVALVGDWRGARPFTVAGPPWSFRNCWKQRGANTLLRPGTSSLSWTPAAQRKPPAFGPLGRVFGRGQNSGIKIEVNLEGNCFLWVCLHFFTHQNVCPAGFSVIYKY